MEKLKFINDQMSIIGIPYQFMEWTSEVKYPYFVGEITETEPMTEDGLEESTFILTGFNRGQHYIGLEELKDKIKEHFNPIYGLRSSTDSGSIAVFFAGSFYVPTGEADLKRIQINLNIKHWKGGKK